MKNKLNNWLYDEGLNDNNITRSGYIRGPSYEVI